MFGFPVICHSSGTECIVLNRSTFFLFLFPEEKIRFSKWPVFTCLEIFRQKWLGSPDSARDCHIVLPHCLCQVEAGKRLSHVTFLLLPLKSSLNVMTVLLPMATLFCVTGMGPVCSRPRYGAPLRG